MMGYKMRVDGISSNQVGFNMIKSTILRESLGESDKYSPEYDDGAANG